MKTLLNNQIICGIKITKNTSKETKYLKSNFLDFLMNIKYANNKSIATNKYIKRYLDKIPKAAAAPNKIQS